MRVAGEDKLYKKCCLKKDRLKSQGGSLGGSLGGSQGGSQGEFQGGSQGETKSSQESSGRTEQLFNACMKGDLRRVRWLYNHGAVFKCNLTLEECNV